MTAIHDAQPLSEVLTAIKAEIPDDQRRQAVYTKLIGSFPGEDGDTLVSCMGSDPAYDAAFRQMHPDRSGG